MSTTPSSDPAHPQPSAALSSTTDPSANLRPTSTLTLRAPSTLPTPNPSPAIPPPTIQWLSGPWSVTHSTLPMWKKNTHVTITYTPIPSTSPPHLDDLVTYRPLNSSKLKTVRGVDKPFSVPNAADGKNTAEGNEGDDELASLAYGWRGKGWLAIASSKWEILGYGVEEGTGNRWVVTFFAKTLFTPEGVDVYSREGRLREETVGAIKRGLEGLGGRVAELGRGMFEVES